MTTRKAAISKQPKQPLIERQPQSKMDAAKNADMNLHTDDSWSQAYWTRGDLHCEERELFG
jgi:hypothetical protein